VTPENIAINRLKDFQKLSISEYYTILLQKKYCANILDCMQAGNFNLCDIFPLSSGDPASTSAMDKNEVIFPFPHFISCGS
jgi:hypothetical protein